MNNNIIYYSKSDSKFNTKSSPIPIPTPPKKYCESCSQRYYHLPIPSSVPNRKVKNLKSINTNNNK